MAVDSTTIDRRKVVKSDDIFDAPTEDLELTGYSPPAVGCYRSAINIPYPNLPDSKMVKRGAEITVSLAKSLTSRGIDTIKAYKEEPHGEKKKSYAAG